MQQASMPYIVVELTDCRKNWLYLIDFGDFIRLEKQVISLFNGAYYLYKTQLGRQELFESLCLIITIVDDFGIFIYFGDYGVEVGQSLLAEDQNFYLALAWLLIDGL